MSDSNENIIDKIVNAGVDLDRVIQSYEGGDRSQSPPAWMLRTSQALAAAHVSIVKLQAIVAKLPVTADGVAITPGMQLWTVEGSSRVATGIGCNDYVITGGELTDVFRFLGAEHYTTKKAAASAASGERTGT